MSEFRPFQIPANATIRVLDGPEPDFTYFTVDQLEEMQYNSNKDGTCVCGGPLVNNHYIPSVDRRTILVLTESSFNKLKSQIQKAFYDEKD